MFCISIYTSKVRDVSLVSLMPPDLAHAYDMKHKLCMSGFNVE